MRFGPVDIRHDDEVLEPRPWTIAQAEWASELPVGPMLELGCGAGHIGLAAAALTGSPLVQVDRSEAACRWAGTNAVAAGLHDRVEQRCGELHEVLDDAERFAVVIADPPYVESSDVRRFPEDPEDAIDGGEDGLDLVRAFLATAARHLAPGGSIVLQLGAPDQIDAVASWLRGPGAPALAVVDRRVVADDRSLALLQAVSA
jgi:methylase of polypeptide subunit release factors